MKAKAMFYANKEFSNAENRAYAREELIFNLTEDLLLFMEDHNVTKSELARKLGKSKSFVTQILGGSRNMTLSSFSDICFSLGFKPEIKIPVNNTVPQREAWIKTDTVKLRARTAGQKTSKVLDFKDEKYWSRAAAA